MEAKPLEKYGEQFGAKWADELFGPLLFLAGGAAGYVVRYGAGGLARRIETADLGSKIVAGAVLAGAVLALTLLCRVADTYVLRLLEGYWPRLLDLPRRKRISSIRCQRTWYEQRWQALALKSQRSEE